MNQIVATANDEESTAKDSAIADDFVMVNGEEYVFK